MLTTKCCVRCAMQLDIWHAARDGVHVLVPPEQLQDAKRHLDDNGVPYQVLNDHIQRHVEQQLY